MPPPLWETLKYLVKVNHTTTEQHVKSIQGQQERHQNMPKANVDFEQVNATERIGFYEVLPKLLQLSHLLCI